MTRYKVRVITEFHYDTELAGDYFPDEIPFQLTSDKELIERMVQYDLDVCPEVIFLELPTDQTIEVLDSDD